MSTLGEASLELAEKYFDIYKRLQNSDDAEIRTKAQAIAEHDLIIMQIKAEFALEKLRALIQSE